MVSCPFDSGIGAKIKISKTPQVANKNTETNGKERTKRGLLLRTQ